MYTHFGFISMAVISQSERVKQKDGAEIAVNGNEKRKGRGQDEKDEDGRGDEKVQIERPTHQRQNEQQQHVPSSSFFPLSLHRCFLRRFYP